MAFPVRISTQNRADVGLQMGPWSLGGALYEFVLDATPTKICIAKSTDGGVTWASPDIANAPALLTNPRYSVTQFGTTIRIVYGDNLGGGGGSNLGTMHAIDFDTLTDTYGAPSDSLIGWGPGGIADPAPSIVAVSLSTSVTRIVFINFTTISTSQLQFVDFDGVSWGTPIDITAIAVSTKVQPQTAVVDASDMIHLPYNEEVVATQSLRYASIAAGGSANGGQLIFTPFNEGFTGTINISGSNLALPVVTPTSPGGQLNILRLWLGTPYAGGAPAWSSVSPDSNTYSATFAYQFLPCTLPFGSTLLLAWSVFDFFNPTANAQVWYAGSTDDGATWGSPVLVYDCALNPPSWAGIGATDEMSFNIISGSIFFTGNIDSEGTATLADIEPGATVSCGNPPIGTVGQPYSHRFPATGLEPFTFTILGPLPDGLGLNSLTGELSGIPTQKGSFPITIHVTDANGAEAEEDCTLTMRSRCLL